MQDWEDANLPHAVRNHAAACRAGWRGWEGEASTACALLCAHMETCKPLSGPCISERGCCGGQRAKGALQVAYIDTEGTFRAEKIRAIAARFDLDADAVLDNVSPAPWLLQCCPWSASP